MANPLIESLLYAVDARPADVPLRLHLAELLLADGRGPEAVQQCAVALQHDPSSVQAHEVMGRAFAQQHPTPEPPAAAPPHPGPTAPAPQAPTGPAAQAPGGSAAGDGTDPTFSWSAAEEQFRDGPGQMFVTDDPTRTESLADGAPAHVPPEDVWEVERAGVTLADVGGMQQVKERLEISFLAPMRNPELRQLYGKSLRGGLLLYGPPGCGKTFLARAVAGEMGAGFINVTLADVLDMYLGQSEGNLHELFQLARRSAPAVLFLDEIDAIGHKRTQSVSGGLRNVVNQLLQELDGVGSENEGVFVLAATNTPWDVDPALRRPGRLDRTVLVLPPDEPARAAILQHNLSRRPVEGINLARLARDTDGFTGADLTHLCESAAELAMIDSVRSGRPRMIGMKDLTTALKQIRPSARPWFDTARNVVTYADPSGEYAELAAYMKQNKLL
ncbi:ATP-binding protein [Granulicoccus phenolivorans]|uniref:ATP-binding protein n=1 Tax=Granulicoccus phenolivorans TaxID=266854 RepID=UPI00041E9A46|nr:ATP-binding protein [Granulicoccus phenolivorans]